MKLRDAAELVRLPAALTVPGDSLAGAVSAGWPYGRRTWAAPAASACLYLAGMALNDFADADLDARERPERPIPSGRVDAFEALGLAAGLTAAGLGLAAVAGGRRALRVAVPLAATVWAYDLWAQRNAAGPAFMAAARGLDVLLGAGGNASAAALPALAVATHTAGVTTLSRGEVHGAGRFTVAAALAGTTAATVLAALGAARTARQPGAAVAAAAAAGGPPPPSRAPGTRAAGGGAARGARAALAALRAGVERLAAPAPAGPRGGRRPAAGTSTGSRGGGAAAGVRATVAAPRAGAAGSADLSRPAPRAGAAGSAAAVAVAAAEAARGAVRAPRAARAASPPAARAGAATGLRGALPALRAGVERLAAPARGAEVAARLAAGTTTGPPGGAAAARVATPPVVAVGATAVAVAWYVGGVGRAQLAAARAAGDAGVVRAATGTGVRGGIRLQAALLAGAGAPAAAAALSALGPLARLASRRVSPT
ncbi:SCO3242 family prenyltransferase [Streptomyces hainanensis]|uniref:SCO3242 family prenyltransferase n=1 Tax=Streptomyces hainanensis TaxID=402648 RepID=UPI0026C9C0A4